MNYFFDLDGSLIDSMAYHDRSWREALEPIGIHLEPGALYELAGVPFMETIEILSTRAGLRLSREQKEVIHQRKVALFFHYFMTRKYPLVDDILRVCKAWGMLVFVTGCALPNVFQGLIARSRQGLRNAPGPV